MTTSPRSGVLRDGLTPAQVRLLRGHERGLVRLAGVLAEKAGRAPTDVMFVLAHSASKVGGIAREQLGGRVVTGTEAVVVPGLATELPTWIARMALAGPVLDCTRGEGVAVVIIDERNEMAVCGVACPTTAASSSSQNRSIIPSG